MKARKKKSAELNVLVVMSNNEEAKVLQLSSEKSKRLKIMNKKTNNKSLKFKLIMLSMGITIGLGAASVGVLSYILKTEEQARMDSFESTAKNLSDAISAQFFERYHDVQNFAFDATVKTNNKDAIVETLNAFTTRGDIYDLIMVVDTKGHLVAVNSKDGQGNALNTNVLYQKNYAETPWFKAVLAGQTTDDKEAGFAGTFFEDVQNDPYSSAVFKGDHLGNSFSSAIKNNKGEITGVVTARAGSRWFETAFTELYTNLKHDGFPSTVISLLDKQGQLIFEYASDPHSAKLDAPKYDWTVLLKYNPAKSGNIAASKVIEGKSGSSIQVSTRTHVEQLTGYAPVSSPKYIESIGWGILVRDSREEAMATLTHARNIFYLIFGVVMLLSAALAYWFSSKLAKSLTLLARRLSEGSTEVASAATQISGASTELSEAALEQASSIQETAASIDEVSSMVKKSSENAMQSQKVSKSSRELAEQGQGQVQEMLHAIKKISESNTAIMNQVADGNHKIGEIVKLIAEIGNKTKVINDIVFQTKLLSFNASVEAARAGEHGKGFAVVAEEVGNLAAMSGNAAKEISLMLESSIKKVEDIVQETKSKVEHLVADGKSKVDSGTLVAEKCGVALTEILSAVHEVDVMVGEISSASHEQSQGVSEINKAINQLDKVTQQNTNVAQQAASAAESLSAQSIDLKQMVESLFELINGNSQDGASQPDHEDDGQKSRPNGVISLQHKRNQLKKSKAHDSPMKLAAGAENVNFSKSAPSSNDPRFEDV